MSSERNSNNNKQFADQFDDEEVLFVFRKHPVVMRKGLIFAALSVLAGTIPSLVWPTLTIFYGGLAAGFLLAAVVFMPSWIMWYYSVFIVTDQRLMQITQKGLFNKAVVDLGLSKIQSINYEVKGLQATLLGFGTILIQTYMGDLVLHEVHKPTKVVRDLSDVLRKQGIEPDKLEEQED